MFAQSGGFIVEINGKIVMPRRSLVDGRRPVFGRIVLVSGAAAAAFAVVLEKPCPARERCTLPSPRRPLSRSTIHTAHDPITI